MIHSELIKYAKHWLRNKAKIIDNNRIRPVKCHVVLSEINITNEIPDAIGWVYAGRYSILLECKTSRADFKADFKKPFRKKASKGMGRFRYYYVPYDLISPDEVPDKWGLIYTNGKRDKVVKYATYQQNNIMEEIKLLYSEINLYQMIENNTLKYKSKRANKFYDFGIDGAGI